MSLKDNIEKYKAAIKAGEPHSNFIFATDGLPICRKTDNRMFFEKIHSIVCEIKALRPHNEKCDLMMVTHDELTKILTDHLKNIFDDAWKYRELRK